MITNLSRKCILFFKIWSEAVVNSKYWAELKVHSSKPSWCFSLTYFRGDWKRLDRPQLVSWLTQMCPFAGSGCSSAPKMDLDPVHQSHWTTSLLVWIASWHVSTAKCAFPSSFLHQTYRNHYSLNHQIYWIWYNGRKTTINSHTYIYTVYICIYITAGSRTLWNGILNNH